MSKSSRIGLWSAVLLLGMAFLVRAYQVTVLPPFNDESHHIRRAEAVWSFDNLDLSFTVGKLLTYYWIGIFNPDRLDGIFVGRTVTGLFALLGLAAAFAVGKRLFGMWGGILTLYLLVFSPFMVFFDRMALTDPITASLGMLTIWASLILLDRPQQWERGIFASVMAWLTILAKLTGLPFAAIPIVAVLFFGAGTLRDKWQTYRATLIACYGTLIALLTPFGLWVVYKELSGNRISVVDPHLINHKTPLETVTDNLGDLWQANSVFHHDIFWIVMVFAIGIGLWRAVRPVGFLLACVALIWGFTMVSSGVLSTRYLQLGIAPLLVAVAGSLIVINPLKPRWLVGWGIATLWLVLVAQPFILNLWNDPRLNTYPERDEWEYFTNFTAGYGLVDAADALPNLSTGQATGRVPVVGLNGSCHQMRLYLDEFGAVLLECPAFGWAGEFMDDVALYINQRAQQEGILYAIVEPDLPYTDLNRLLGEHDVLYRFARPFEGMTVEVWRIYPDETITEDTP